MESVVLKLDQINYDGSTQPRVDLNEQAVADYAEALTSGIKLPPVIVFFDGAQNWLADGFHRFHAHRKIGAYDIQAAVHRGTKRDAILYSVGANAAHGLRRTNDDKRKAVLTLLADDEWAQWPQAKIAQACGVSREYVSRVHSSLDSSCDRSQDAVRTVERGGKTYTQNTANIGKKKAETPPASKKKPVRTLKSAPPPEEQMGSADELAEAQHAIADLASENERLIDRLAVGVMDASQEEKSLATKTIAELRQQVRTLEQENDALKASRDTYMHQLAEMKKQVNYWRKKAEKVAA